MAHIVFAPAIQRHVAIAAQQVEAETVLAALMAVFSVKPALRDYIIDEQSRLRRHVAVFVDGQLLDRKKLQCAIDRSTEIYVAQALSGG